MQTGLIRRGARYSLRRRIPNDLVKYYGRSEIVRALGSSDPLQAPRLLPHAWAAMDAEFDTARAAIGSGSDPAAPCISIPVIPLPPAGVSAGASEDDDPGSPTVSELHALWLKQEDRPASTVKETQRAVDRFVKLIGDKRISAVTRRDITAFSDKLREPGAVSSEGVSIPTTNTTLSLISALLGFARKRNLIESNPALGTQLKDINFRSPGFRQLPT